MKQTENSKKKNTVTLQRKFFSFHVGIYAGFNNKLTPSNNQFLSVTMHYRTRYVLNKKAYPRLKLNSL